MKKFIGLRIRLGIGIVFEKAIYECHLCISSIEICHPTNNLIDHKKILYQNIECLTMLLDQRSKSTTEQWYEVLNCSIKEQIRYSYEKRKRKGEKNQGEQEEEEEEEEVDKQKCQQSAILVAANGGWLAGCADGNATTCRISSDCS